MSSSQNQRRRTARTAQFKAAKKKIGNKRRLYMQIANEKCHHEGGEIPGTAMVPVRFEYKKM